jgi:transposase-like protein
MGVMISYTKAAMERAMKVQEVILRALAKKISWWQAAEIIGISDRQLRRWRERYEEFGFRGVFDRRRGKPSPKRVPVATLERVLELANQPIAPWRVYQDQSGGITSGFARQPGAIHHAGRFLLPVRGADFTVSDPRFSSFSKSTP